MPKMIWKKKWQLRRVPSVAGTSLALYMATSLNTATHHKISDIYILHALDKNT